MKTKKNLPFFIAVFLLALLVAMVSKQVHADEARKDYFYLPPGSANVSALTESDYTAVISKFLMRYFNKVYTTTGKPLVIPFEWNSPFFAAFAESKEGYMKISLWGGMARAPGASKSVLAAVLCHELGHILGGEPRQTIPGSEWGSIEGQSDFYAAAVCLPDFFRAHPELAPVVSSEVEQVCKGNKDCGVVLQTGLETVRFLQAYSYREYTPVSIFSTEKPIDKLILNTYPSDQCRLDSFIQGARCQLGGACRAPNCWLPDNQVDAK